jgi:hypothetical protein
MIKELLHPSKVFLPVCAILVVIEAIVYVRKKEDFDLGSDTDFDRRMALLVCIVLVAIFI